MNLPSDWQNTFDSYNAALTRRQFFRQKLAHLTLELQFFFAEIEIHDINLVRLFWYD